MQAAPLGARLVKVYGACTADREHVCLIMELLEGGGQLCPTFCAGAGVSETGVTSRGRQEAGTRAAPRS